MIDHSCIAAREWLSDARDGEALDDPRHDSHLAGCPDCRAWVAAFDRVHRTVRLRSPRPSTAARTRILATACERPGAGPNRVATAMLAVAAVGMVVAFGLATAGIFGHSHLGTPEGRDSEALMISLAGGYALAAWRPARLAAGLFPVALLAAVVTAITSVAALWAGTASLGAEVAHLPILLGAVGTFLAARPMLPDAIRPVREAESGGLAPA